MESLNGVGKILIGGVVSLLVAGIATHMAVATKHVTRSEASVMIEKESPYVKDRNLIINELKSLNTSQSDMRDDMQRLLENSRTK